MCFLIPIKYNKRNYPERIVPKIEELAGNFKKTSINPSQNMNYCLHTEYSYLAKDFDKNIILEDLPTIKKSHKNFVPKLWINAEWSKEFIFFIKKLVNDNIPPKLIEIHPPFNDYCKRIEDFIDIYSIFENDILKEYPKTEILIENRAGTRYSGGKFLISTQQDIINLFRFLRNTQLKLKLVLDIPQLFTAHKINFYSKKIINGNNITDLLQPLEKYKDKIAGIHIWGKKKSVKGNLLAHHGDLNTFFNQNQNMKNIFLLQMYELFNDGNSRYFVPEVNSGNEDVKSIVNDFINTGFEFIY